MRLRARPAVNDEDRAWAYKYGWIWDNYEEFVLVTDRDDPFIRVIENPVGEPGWVVWLRPIGALQMDAPFASARAALRIAESIRRQRPLTDDEMSCAEKISPLELLAMEGL